MKKFYLLPFLLLGGFQSQAQSSKYEAAIKQNLAVLDTAKTAANLQKLASSFERIATSEKTQWLPYYYASYCAIRVVKFERDLGVLDSKLDNAEALAQKANALSPNNSEIFCLDALIAFARINVDFMARGPKYSAIATEALLKAQQLDPTNPRAYLLIGQSKYNTPEQFGGDKKRACQFFDKASALFNTSAASPITPHWGKSDVVRYVARCQQPTAAAAPVKN